MDAEGFFAWLEDSLYFSLSCIDVHGGVGERVAGLWKVKLGGWLLAWEEISGRGTQLVFAQNGTKREDVFRAADEKHLRDGRRGFLHGALCGRGWDYDVYDHFFRKHEKTFFPFEGLMVWSVCR